jgi:hypothetical protein
MGKRRQLATRAFGAEPGLPGVTALAAWIAENRGRTADIVTFQLEASLAPQVAAGIQTPCAGGLFYATRILDALDGIKDRKATGEFHIVLPGIVEDTAGIVVQKRGSWCAIPAPHALAIADQYYRDAEDWNDAICGEYRTLMRAMRDGGVAGNVLVCSDMQEAELAVLARQKVFFFQPEPDRESLACLMEHQRSVAVRKEHLPVLFDLTSEYPLRKIFIIDPDTAAIRLACSHLDPDQIVAGGYCADGSDTYWEALVSSATYTAD